jgi:ABC-type antimicrobial peptide transport system permease subunit
MRERLDQVDPQPVMYQTYSQIPDADMALVNGYEAGAVLIRTLPGVATVSISQAIQQALLADDQLPATKVRTTPQLSLDSTARQNFNLLLLGMFAAIALLLAAVGIYGVTSCSVEQRTHEIGIRTALGANRRSILSLVLAQVLRLTLAGIAAGVVASFALTRLLSAQLFEVKPLDPLTFAAVPLILLGVALLAGCLPARRVSRLDPLVALRHD